MEKKYQKQRATGAAVLAAVVVIFTFVGAKMTFNRMYRQVEDVFYNGEQGDGIGVAADLSDRADFAMQLTQVAGRYLNQTGGVTAEVAGARQSLLDAKNISDKYKADKALEDAMQRLYDELGQQALSDADARLRRTIYAGFTDRGDTSSHDGYNLAAQQYNQKLMGFPAAVLAGVTGAQRAELFR